MNTPNRWRTNYSNAEIRELVEGYEELRELRSTSSSRGILILVKLADLGKAVKRLSPREYEAIVLCGMIGLTMRTSGKLLGVSAQTMSNRYNHGLSSLARYLNGGS
jgi:DNA-directed RNA polymerase specialized sigma24 family protein